MDRILLQHYLGIFPEKYAGIVLYQGEALVGDSDLAPFESLHVALLQLKTPLVGSLPEKGAFDLHAVFVLDDDAEASAFALGVGVLLELRLGGDLALDGPVHGTVRVQTGDVHQRVAASQAFDCVRGRRFVLTHWVGHASSVHADLLLRWVAALLLLGVLVGLLSLRLISSVEVILVLILVRIIAGYLLLSTEILLRLSVRSGVVVVHINDLQIFDVENASSWIECELSHFHHRVFLDPALIQSVYQRRSLDDSPIRIFRVCYVVCHVQDSNFTASISENHQQIKRC